MYGNITTMFLFARIYSQSSSISACISALSFSNINLASSLHGMEGGSVEAYPVINLEFWRLMFTWMKMGTPRLDFI